MIHFIPILRTFYAESSYLWNFVYSHNNDMRKEYIDVGIYWNKKKNLLKWKSAT